MAFNDDIHNRRGKAVTKLEDIEEALQDALSYVSIYLAINRLGGKSKLFPPFDPAAHVLRRAGMILNGACAQRSANQEVED